MAARAPARRTSRCAGDLPSVVAGEPPVLLDDHPSLAAAVEAGNRRSPPWCRPSCTGCSTTRTRCAALRTLRTRAARRRPDRPGAPQPRWRRRGERGRDVRLGGDCRRLRLRRGAPLDGVALATEADGRLRISGPMLFDGYDGDPELTARGARSTAGSAPRTPPGSTRTAGSRCSAGSTTSWSAAASTSRRRRSRSGCASTPPSGTSRCSASPTRSGGSRLVAFVVGDPDVDLELATARAWVADVHPRSWAPRRADPAGRHADAGATARWTGFSSRPRPPRGERRGRHGHHDRVVGGRSRPRGLRAVTSGRRAPVGCGRRPGARSARRGSSTGALGVQRPGHADPLPLSERDLAGEAVEQVVDRRARRPARAPLPARSRVGEGDVVLHGQRVQEGQPLRHEHGAGRRSTRCPRSGGPTRPGSRPACSCRCRTDRSPPARRPRARSGWSARSASTAWPRTS